MQFKSDIEGEGDTGWSKDEDNKWMRETIACARILGINVDEKPKIMLDFL